MANATIGFPSAVVAEAPQRRFVFPAMPAASILPESFDHRSTVGEGTMT
jgi:hypothetical protein